MDTKTSIVKCHRNLLNRCLDEACQQHHIFIREKIIIASNRRNKQYDRVFVKDIDK
jgi:hypothetical protein